MIALRFRVGVSDLNTVIVRDGLPLPCQQASRTLQRLLRSFLLHDDDANVCVNMLPYKFDIVK